jgi:aminopeptidase-like protein
MLWVLNLSDGNHTLLEIADRSDFAFDTIKEAAQALLKRDLLREVLE